MALVTEPTNILIKDVNLNWARLDRPATNPFGGPDAWEVQISTTNKAKAKELKDKGLNVKEKDGEFSVNLRRKSKRQDGSDMSAVRVVDASKTPMGSDQIRQIGNGSRGNVIIWAAPYNHMGRSGLSFSLTAVQVTDLKVYTPEADVDFEIETDSVDEVPDIF